MPAIASGKVLVTGANGYVAVWLVKQLLEQGFSVRGTVRSPAKAEHLKKLFASHGDKLEFVVVEDITKDGAFDEAVKGVDAIQHTASPFHFNAVDPSEIIGPAVAGTGTILQSALKFGTNVKRVVVLSSTAAVQEAGLPEPKVFTEKDWNNKAIEEVETKGKDADQIEKYTASKTLAEKAAWAWYEKNKAQLKWDLVVVNPPFVFGPLIHEISDVSALNTSMNLWYLFVLKGAGDAATLATVGNCWADVRDVATALVRALEKPEAGGERFIISAGPWKWQDWVNSARKFSPSVPAGNTEWKRETNVDPIITDSSKASKVLGVTYIPLDQTTKDILADFEQRGWWKS
ncbi:unnamed protein product [Somion occarium]|uniref:NAD-dependent epimerase/dehydratase domain-containing protein n=1 Tax=Somion occarium TaxID=3059160 RepID=A0ABP1DQM8_9APHY